jgi:putative transcriptional regulator
VDMISYRPLWVLLAERGLKKGYLHAELGIAGTTIAKMGKDEYVALEIIDKICEHFEVAIEKIIEHVKEKK